MYVGSVSEPSSKQRSSKVHWQCEHDYHENSKPCNTARSCASDLMHFVQCGSRSISGKAAYLQAAAVSEHKQCKGLYKLNAQATPTWHIVAATCDFHVMFQYKYVAQRACTIVCDLMKGRQALSKPSRVSEQLQAGMDDSLINSYS